MDERAIVMEKEASQEWKRMMLEVYSEVVELATRNRRARELLGKKIGEQSMVTLDHLFLGYKICLWEKDGPRAQIYLKRMETEQLTNYQVFRLAVN
jgi:hypothetical protein